MLRWKVVYEVTKTTLETNNVFAYDAQEAMRDTEAFLQDQGYIVQKCISIEDIPVEAQLRKIIMDDNTRPFKGTQQHYC